MMVSSRTFLYCFRFLCRNANNYFCFIGHVLSKAQQIDRFVSNGLFTCIHWHKSHVICSRCLIFNFQTSKHLQVSRRFFSLTIVDTLIRFCRINVGNIMHVDNFNYSFIIIITFSKTIEKINNLARAYRQQKTQQQKTRLQSCIMVPL